MTESSEVLDLVILGAGIYGICAANTYLSLYPRANIRVLDADTDVGGVWSRSRSYPKFWSQSGTRVTGFSDVPFKLPAEAKTYYDLFESKYVTEYLQDYVSNQTYNGRSLRERFIFSCWITNLTKDAESGLWLAQCTQDGTATRYTAKKAIVATGHTSSPSMPNLPGKEHFRGTILHQKDLGHSGIFTDAERESEKHTHITVIGGGKSAADIAYAAATDILTPRTVSWIVRRSGAGPVIISPAKAPVKYRNLTETASTRLIGNVSSANPYLAESRWSRFLQRTAVGEWLLEAIWRDVEGKAADVARFGRKDALAGFDGLRSSTNIRWRTAQAGILQNDDFWEVVAKKVHVHRKDIAELSEDAVVLEDGTRVVSDVVFCATGWKLDHPYISEEDAAQLGLPVDLKEEKLVEEDREYWARMEEEAEAKVLERWPNLAHAPKFKFDRIPKTPYRLYNMIVPLEDQSIAFLGQMPVPNSYHMSLVQALYAIAVLEGSLTLPPRKEMEEHIAFIGQWCALRYPVNGHLGNLVEFEMVGYTDHLLAQLGLRSHRGLHSRWRELADPLLATDYTGLVEEYSQKYVKTEP